MPHTYPRPWNLVPGLAAAMIARRQRSFRRDAQAAVRLLKPPLEIRGQEHIPASGPFLLTINHYGRLGFPSWWLTMALSCRASGGGALDHDRRLDLPGTLVYGPGAGI